MRKLFKDILLLKLHWSTGVVRFYISYPESEGNKNARSASLNDELGVIELQVVVQDNLGRLVHTVQAVVAEQQDVQIQISSLLLGLDIRQSTLNKFISFFYSTTAETHCTQTCRTSSITASSSMASLEFGPNSFAAFFRVST